MLSQNHNRPNPWEKKQSMASSIYWVNICTFKTCRYKMYIFALKRILELENILFLVSTFAISWLLFYCVWKFLTRNFTSYNFKGSSYCAEKSTARDKKILCLWVPPSSAKLYLRFDCERWPSGKGQKKVLKKQWEKAEQKRGRRRSQRGNVLFVFEENSVTVVLW